MSANDHRNIVLTGFMGTGKTTVGRILADRLGYRFVDTDELIEERHGPIAAIFRDRGEEAFRAIERELATELGDRTELVVSTGGGLMLDPTGGAVLAASGAVFCLVAEPDEILARVTADASRPERPLLTGPDPEARIRELLADRAEGYRRFTQIPTGGRPPDIVVGDILAVLGSAAPTGPVG